MNHVMKALVAAGLVGLAAPAVAQDSATMTCEEFMAMDAEGQSAAMETLQADAMASGGTGAATGTATTDTATAGTATTGTATADAGATGTADADATMEEQMASMMAACEADPSMLAMDAMNADS